MEEVCVKKYSNFTPRKRSYENVVPKNFKTLPVKILGKVFEYLDKDDLLKRVSLVCKHWRHATMQPQFIKTFHICGNKMTLPYIYDYIRQFKDLKALYIENVSSLTVILLQAHKFNLDLRILSLKNCNILDFNVLKYILNKFPNLEKIEISNTSFTGNALRYSAISRLKNLKSLSFVQITNLTMKDLLETVLNCPFLEELTIGLLPPNVDLRDDTASLLIVNLAPRLTYLNLDSHSLTARTFSNLQNCPNLRKLHIKYGVNLNKEFLHEFWKNIPPLEELGFTHNCIITGEDVHDLFSENSFFENITHLDFTFCVLLNDKGIKAISGTCPLLKTILLRSCKSITSVDSIYKNCKDLRCIDISFCPSLKLGNYIPKSLEKLQIDGRNDFLELLPVLKTIKTLRIYKAVCEYTDEYDRF